MALKYRIRRGHGVAREVRRILLAQNRQALRLLENWQESPRERIHGARQCFKRVRALLRLIRPAAPYAFEVENRFYRDLGRSFAYVRDADAVIEALAAVEPDLGDRRSRESLAVLRTALERRAARDLADPATQLPQRVAAACAALREADRRLRQLPLQGVDRKALGRGLRRTFRRCEKRFGRVIAGGTAADFHAWRQQVKYAWNQTRLMARTAGTNAGRPGLARLADILGHGQDLALLDALLRAQSDDLQLDRHLECMRGVIGERLQATRAEASLLGALVFADAAPAIRPRATDARPPVVRA
jgi:CHAD domain-containing protein